MECLVAAGKAQASVVPPLPKVRSRAFPVHISATNGNSTIPNYAQLSQRCLEVLPEVLGRRRCNIFQPPFAVRQYLARNPSDTHIGDQSQLHNTKSRPFESRIPKASMTVLGRTLPKIQASILPPLVCVLVRSKLGTDRRDQRRMQDSGTRAFASNVLRIDECNVW